MKEEPKTERGQFRKITSGDGRKNFDTDVRNEFEESFDMLDE